MNGWWIDDGWIDGRLNNWMGGWWLDGLMYINALTSMKREMVCTAWSVSLKTSLQVKAEPAGRGSSDALDRKLETSDTRHSVPLSWLLKKEALALFWSRVWRRRRRRQEGGEGSALEDSTGLQSLCMESVSTGWRTQWPSGSSSCFLFLICDAWPRLCCSCVSLWHCWPTWGHLLQ